MIMTLKPERMSPQSQRESFSYVIYIYTCIHEPRGFFFVLKICLFIPMYMYIKH